MNVYRNKITGAVIEIPSKIGSNEVWEDITPAPAAEKVKAEPVEDVKVAEAPKKKATARKAVKK